MAARRGHRESGPVDYCSSVRSVVMKRSVRTLRTIGVILAVAFAAVVASSPAAGATYVSSCSCAAHGGNWTASACLYNGTFQYGTYAEWNSNPQAGFPAFLAAHPGVHINRSIWAYSKCDLTAFVETGFWTDSTGTTHFYSAAKDLVGGTPLPNYIATVPQDGSHHIYRVSFEGPTAYGGKYAVWIDGINRAVYYAQGLSGTCLSQAGLEISQISCTSQPPDPWGRVYSPDACWAANDTTQGSLAWQDNSYGYHWGWDTSQYWIDWPCYPRSLLVLPNCIVGNFVGNSKWKTQK